MNRLAWVACLITILLASIFYAVVSSSPSSLSNATLLMPIVFGGLVGSLYIWLRALFAARNVMYTIGLLRQGALVGLGCGVLLYLQGLRVLGPVDAALIVGAAILLEIFFQAEKTDVRTPHK